MKIDNRLVAYIQYDNREPYIDTVEVYKKGSSFLYDEKWWTRTPILMSGYCTNEKGEKLKINSLSHVHNPYVNYNGEIEVISSAREI